MRESVIGRWVMRREVFKRERASSGCAAGTRPAEIIIGIRFVVS